jgi:subtilisin family serine protease
MGKLVLASLAVLALLAVTGATTALGGANASPTHYTIAFKQKSGLPGNVDKLVADAGGTIVERLPEIGGIGVVSSNPDFAAAMGKGASVYSTDVSAEAMLPVDPDMGIESSDNNGGNSAPTGSDTQPMPDSLGAEQWDKKKMHATLTGSYAVQRGSRDVRVFVIDTGADMTHPDVAPNLDVAASRSFVPSEPTIQDFHGHGTWTISAVGAPINTIGISGVAPGVTLVEGKVLNGAGSGLFLWTDIALIYAGLQHFDIVSASLGGYIPKCGNKQVDADGNPICDHADYILLHRATQFARENGVLPIAAMGNDGFDLGDGSFFRYFIEAPGEVPGWVGVSATGYDDGKAWYSNYGQASVDVSAPGGSTRDYSGVGGSAQCNGHGGVCRLIGAWSSTHLPNSLPASPHEECVTIGGVPQCALYGYVQGTSMATPNAAGVAALIVSQNGHMSPTKLESLLQKTANNQPCPDQRTVTQSLNPSVDQVPATATCQGGTGQNSFFGKGIVDALNAVTAK